MCSERALKKVCSEGVLGAHRDGMGQKGVFCPIVPPHVCLLLSPVICFSEIFQILALSVTYQSPLRDLTIFFSKSGKSKNKKLQNPALQKAPYL